jgi:D-arabinose 1-dehydrogenase-like Zn-dependent alcohol dehydrogenase
MKTIGSVAGSLTFILDTVSAPHDLNLYLSLLRVNGCIFVLEYHQRPNPRF